MEAGAGPLFLQDLKWGASRAPSAGKPPSKHMDIRTSPSPHCGQSPSASSLQASVTTCLARHLPTWDFSVPPSLSKGGWSPHCVASSSWPLSPPNAYVPTQLTCERS